MKLIGPPIWTVQFEPLSEEVHKIYYERGLSHAHDGKCADYEKILLFSELQALSAKDSSNISHTELSLVFAIGPFLEGIQKNLTAFTELFIPVIDQKNKSRI